MRLLDKRFGIIFILMGLVMGCQRGASRSPSEDTAQFNLVGADSTRSVLASSTVTSNYFLSSPGELRSTNGAYRMVMQSDGNLCLYPGDC
ncbi:MAG: hypothetical protein CUN55_18640, partial [Phototrophicales bacterium]